MINKLNLAAELKVDVLHSINNGMLVLYKQSSGNYIMLKELINSLRSTNSKFIETNYINIDSICENHLEYQALKNTYKIHDSLALMIVRNSEVTEVVKGQISYADLADVFARFKSTYEEV